LNREALSELYAYGDFVWAAYDRSVCALPEDSIGKAVQGSGWPALIDAFRHMVSGTDGWLNNALGLGPVLGAKPEVLGDWAAVDSLRRQLRDEITGLLSELSDDELFVVRHKVFPESPRATMTVADVLLHLALHDRGHYGDISTLLYQLGAEPPAADSVVYYFLRPQRQSWALRSSGGGGRPPPPRSSSHPPAPTASSWGLRPQTPAGRPLA
jgi:uncharacterized damage-inducible protein DinB